MEYTSNEKQILSLMERICFRNLSKNDVLSYASDIDKIMPPVSRFGGSGRAKRKEALIRRLMMYFEKFRGLV